MNRFAFACVLLASSPLSAQDRIQSGTIVRLIADIQLPVENFGPVTNSETKFEPGTMCFGSGNRNATDGRLTVLAWSGDDIYMRYDTSAERSGRYCPGGKLITKLTRAQVIKLIADASALNKEMDDQFMERLKQR